jgi:mutator protein MutT
VIERDGRFLVCQRPAHKRHGGLWEFPGGKLEPGESDAEAAARELQEELGVTVTHVARELFGVEDPGSPFHIAFIPVAISGAPACLEHSALRWASPDELRALALAPSDRRFVDTVLVARDGPRR